MDDQDLIHLSKIIIIISISILIIFYLIKWLPPVIYQEIYGNKIMNQQIEELKLADYNCYEKFTILNNWLNEEISDKNRNVINPNYSGSKLFKIWRIDGPYAAWTIKYRYGACGEGAWYLTTMLNKTGCKARTINKDKWSHAWTEFIDENGTKYYAEAFVNAYVDKNEFIDSIKTYSSGYDKKRDMNICIWIDIDKKFYARTNEFNKEDITDEYYPYVSEFRYDSNNCRTG